MGMTVNENQNGKVWTNEEMAITNSSDVFFSLLFLAMMQDWAIYFVIVAAVDHNNWEK